MCDRNLDPKFSLLIQNSPYERTLENYSKMFSQKLKIRSRAQRTTAAVYDRPSIFIVQTKN